MKILCVGISVQDRIFSVDSLPKEEGKFFARNLKEQGGGPAATAAVACARLGIDTDMIARVGDDATGQGILDELKNEGVNVGKMRVIKNAISTQASILVDQQGNRIIVSYPSPSLDVDASFMETIDFSQYNMVLADVRWHEGALKAFELANKADTDLGNITDDGKGVIGNIAEEALADDLNAKANADASNVTNCPGFATISRGVFRETTG